MSRALLAVDPIVRAVYAAAAENAPLVRVYSASAAPYLGVLVDTATKAIGVAIEAAGVATLVRGLRAENAVLRSEVVSMRLELSRARAALREANAAAGEILARGPLGTLEAAVGADTLS